MAAVIHDWGESIIPDINYFEKTTADALAEEEVFAANLANFYAAGDPETVALINEATETVIFDRESRLGSMFNVIERVGYLRTGLRADQHVREGSAPDCEENLRWLSASVISSDHIKNLIVKGEHLFAAHDFLILRQEDISDAYNTAEPRIFYSHEPRLEDAHTRSEELEKAQLVWETWQAGLRSPIRHF